MYPMIPYMKQQSLYYRVGLVLLRLVGAVLATIKRSSGYLLHQIDFIRLRFFEFTPRPDDIFIVTYPRSGTTWMQMILYQLTTDGNMDFTHISEVSPWFERVAMKGETLESFPSPRIIKSHLRYRWIPKGTGKYIYVARNGKDVAVSFFKFYQSHLGFQGSFSDFFERFMAGKVESGLWFQHVAEWWAHRNDDHVLFLRYEDLKTDLAGEIRKIIKFCELDVPPERLPLIVERCSFAFMKQHQDKFDHITRILWENGWQKDAFIRKGEVGNGANQFDRQQEMLFDQAFESHLGGSGLAFDAQEETALSATAAQVEPQTAAKNPETYP